MSPAPGRVGLRCAAALGLVLASSGPAPAHPVFVLTGDDGTGCAPLLCNATIEVVDLDTLTLLRNLPLGLSRPVSLAVSSDGTRCWVSDVLGGVRIIDGVTGASGGTIPVNAPGDLVLSHDGAMLYVVSGDTVVKLDTTTNLVAGTGLLNGELGRGIALSRDGSVLGVCAVDSVLYLFDADTMALLRRIRLFEFTGCTELAHDVAFTDTGRAIVWGANCDDFYQVDLATQAQVSADTVDYVADTDSTFRPNVARFSALSGRGYSVTAENGLAVLTPSPPAGNLVPGFSSAPLATALTPDERYLLVAVFGGPDTLDTVDVTVGNFNRAVYTFGARTGEHVLDMVAPPMEAQAEGLLRVARAFDDPPRIPHAIFATDPCTRMADIPTCDEAQATVDDYHDPELPLSDPCDGTLVFFAYDSDHDVPGTIDDILVTKDPLSPGACLVGLR